MSKEKTAKIVFLSSLIIITGLMIIVSLNMISTSSNDVTFSFEWDVPANNPLSLDSADSLELWIYSDSGKLTLISYTQFAPLTGTVTSPSLLEKIPDLGYYEVRAEVYDFNNPTPSVMNTVGSGVTVTQPDSSDIIQLSTPTTL